jgi:hypothetical protein
MPRLIHVKDLPDLTGTRRSEPDPSLFCQNCSCSWSANKGDYFNLPKDHIFTCSECKEPLMLVRKRVVIEEVEA